MRVRVSAVFEQDGEILCMKYIYGGKDVYAIPGGGVDKDIPLKDAVIDEWKNELGVKLEVGDIIMVGEAPGTKRHPQTLHIVFAADGVHGIPKVRPESTHSLDIAWVPVGKLKEYPLYPDISAQLYEYFRSSSGRSIEFMSNCMERGFW
ncbi:MAG: NUDIX hydrolase [Syntrophales bacterium]|nr:NUDIX hydrolase [Syntrophales bacterium]